MYGPEEAGAVYSPSRPRLTPVTPSGPHMAFSALRGEPRRIGTTATGSTEAAARSNDPSPRRKVRIDLRRDGPGVSTAVAREALRIVEEEGIDLTPYGIRTVPRSLRPATSTTSASGAVHARHEPAARHESDALSTSQHEHGVGFSSANASLAEASTTDIDLTQSVDAVLRDTGAKLQLPPSPAAAAHVPSVHPPMLTMPMAGNMGASGTPATAMPTAAAYHAPLDCLTGYASDQADEHWQASNPHWNVPIVPLPLPIATR